MPAEATQTQDKIEQFIRLCLQSQWNPEAMQIAARMAAHGEVNWTELDARAHAQRLKPLLYDILRDQKFVPPETLDRFANAYSRTALYNLYLDGELKHILQRANNQSIRVLVLKGAALSQTVYRESAQRPLRDVDILVPRDQVVRVESIVEALGYRTERMEIQTGANLAYECEALFYKVSPVYSQIEIHWSLIDSPFYQEKLSTEWFWQTACPFNIGGTPALMLGAEAQTLYLCAHLLLHHGGNDLLWLNDIVQVLRLYQQSFDWDELIRYAQVLELVLPLQTILPVLAEEWRAPIPADILARIRALPVNPMETRVAHWLTAPDLPRVQRFWHDLVSLRGRAQFEFALGNLFPSYEYMQRRYHIAHTWMLPLYYLYRWGRGVSHLVSKRV